MVEVEGLARDNDIYGGSPCSFVNGGNNSISNAILEGASSDALAGDPVKAIFQVLPWLKTAFPAHLGLPRIRLKLSDQSDASC